MLVPPMSKVMASGNPFATAAAAPARTPPAGPDSSNAAGSSAASATGSKPPAEVMTCTSSATSSMPRRYDRQSGRSVAFTTVVTVRSYSRISGDTSWEQVTSRPSARSVAATACSWDGFRSAWRRHTATPATSTGIDGSEPGSMRRSSRPSAARRPATSNRHARGTSGSGRTTDESYSEGRSCRAISITSRRPSVVTRATAAPWPSSSALVATVVPWASRAGRTVPASAATPARTACPGSVGVESTFEMRPSSPTASVKVPPVSAPTRMGRR